MEPVDSPILKTGGFPQLCYSGFPEATVSTLSMHGGFADFPAGERGAQQVPANGGLLSHQGALGNARSTVIAQMGN